jgi:hypothetical protein
MFLSPPNLIPTMSSVRAQMGPSFQSALANYALAVAARTNMESAEVLHELYDRLPARHADPITDEVPAKRRIAGRHLADDAAHDRYFHIYRESQADPGTFLRSIIAAASLFHAEVAATYGPPEMQRFVAVGLGLASLLGQIGGIRIAPVAHTIAVASEVPAPIDPMRRWVLGHQIFGALTQALIFSLQEFERAMRRRDREGAADALKVAADLFVASATAFRFTADFPASFYRDVVRPSMMTEQVGEGFSGLLSVDHRQLVAVMVRTRPLMVEAASCLASEHGRLTSALNQVYDDHRFVCAQFDGAKKPSLLCPNSSPLPGVEQLERYRHARVSLLRSAAATDPIILE